MHIRGCGQNVCHTGSILFMGTIPLGVTYVLLSCIAVTIFIPRTTVASEMKSNVWAGELCLELGAAQ